MERDTSSAPGKGQAQPVAEPIVIDCNVLVSALLTRNPEAPPSRILRRALAGDLVFLLSQDLLLAYRTVLSRPQAPDWSKVMTPSD